MVFSQFCIEAMIGFSKHRLLWGTLRDKSTMDFEMCWYALSQRPTRTQSDKRKRIATRQRSEFDNWVEVTVVANNYIYQLVA